MKSTKNSSESKNRGARMSMRTAGTVVLLMVLTVFVGIPAMAHCDSFDGPVIKDAQKAFETNDVNMVLKWVNHEQEQEIISLFRKTYNLKNGDKKVYGIVEKHFLETLVRLHRETENAPYTGLKPSGSTKMIVQLGDAAIAEGSVDDLAGKLNNHIEQVVRKKYNRVASLKKVKDDSVGLGREYVEAYVDYTHTLEAIHNILEHGSGGHASH
jgi:hypothetical protein